jgi:hypothetical protein
VNLGLLYSRIREDEKLLLTELRARGHEVTKIDVRSPAFTIGDSLPSLADVDLAINRCMESSRVRNVAELVDHYDVPIVVVDHHHPDPEAVDPLVEGGDVAVLEGRLLVVQALL